MAQTTNDRRNSVTNNSVARVAILLLCSIVSLACYSQVMEGTSYYLPKTAMKFTLTVEKTQYEPGQFAGYAQRYMKLDDVQLEASTTYRLIGTSMHNIALPDTAKHFTLSLDKRYTISTVERTDNGQLLAINAEPKRVAEPVPFVPARKAKVLNPKDFMGEDILTAGSTAKMAQLIAQEIYDIRDSRNQLQRGQAEFMPADGQQLRIMMDGLDTQERALRQVFEGVTVKDTAEVTLVFVPTENVERQLLFRFSRHFGLVDNDDLSGVPYYITVNTDAKAADDADAQKKEKKDKDDIGLVVNTPQKVNAILYCENKVLDRYEFNAGQFGGTESLSGALFGKKLTTKLVLNPLTGGIESIKEEVLEK
ncbi:MAG: DUF4831 family protein [Prevotella sp.]|nr:DUF4831 family protein [Prevotella sp.]